MRALSLALAYLPVYAASQYPSPPQTPPQAPQLQTRQRPMGCSDPRPFQLDYNKWWRCSSDAMNCYNKIVTKVLKNVHSRACTNDTCLAPSAPGYSKSLGKYLNDSLSKQERLPANGSKQCPWSKWTSEMDFVANVILQKSKRCQVDHVAIFVLFDATQRLFKQEERCLSAGMSDNRERGAILESLLDQCAGTASNNTQSTTQPSVTANTPLAPGGSQPTQSGSLGDTPIVKAGQ